MVRMRTFRKSIDCGRKAAPSLSPTILLARAATLAFGPAMTREQSTAVGSISWDVSAQRSVWAIRALMSSAFPAASRSRPPMSKD